MTRWSNDAVLETGTDPWRKRTVFQTVPLWLVDMSLSFTTSAYTALSVQVPVYRDTNVLVLMFCVHQEGSDKH